MTNALPSSITCALISSDQSNEPSLVRTANNLLEIVGGETQPILGLLERVESVGCLLPDCPREIGLLTAEDHATNA